MFHHSLRLALLATIFSGAATAAMAFGLAPAGVALAVQLAATVLGAVLVVLLDRSLQEARWDGLLAERSRP